jgi:hypothetical protein
MKGGEIFFAGGTEQSHFTECLGIRIFDGKAAVGILHIMGSGDDFFGNL